MMLQGHALDILKTPERIRERQCGLLLGEAGE